MKFLVVQFNNKFNATYDLLNKSYNIKKHLNYLEEKVNTRKLMCNAKIRTGSGKDTGRTAAVYAVWHEN